MSNYIENPKTLGSGILCCIPQTGECPVKCKDCFFQSGRSYLEPLSDNLPNLPDPEFANNFVVRMNDGNDSNVDKKIVVETASKYRDVFFNTSFANSYFPNPVVVTINPAELTDIGFHKLTGDLTNVMFVRFRINMWNIELAKEAVEYYNKLDIPVVFTFMAYYTEEIPEEHKDKYIWMKRHINSYYVLKSEYVKEIKETFKYKKVYFCGAQKCKDCGRCLTEYFNTKRKMYKNA